MEQRHRASAESVRSRIARGRHDAQAFRAALLAVPTASRDAWLDAVLGLDDVPDDGPALPRGCVPYFPCAVDVLLGTVDLAGVRPSDVFVDVGSGPGRAAALVHLLTGASVVGIEIQPHLVLAARELCARVCAPSVSFLEGDAASLAGTVTTGSVFFLYCPFSGDRLASVLAGIEAIARTRALRVCCVDLPLPPCPWLTRDPRSGGDLAVYFTDRPGRFAR